MFIINKSIKINSKIIPLHNLLLRLFQKYIKTTFLEFNKTYLRRLIAPMVPFPQKSFSCDRGPSSSYFLPSTRLYTTQIQLLRELWRMSASHQPTLHHRRPSRQLLYDGKTLSSHDFLMNFQSTICTYNIHAFRISVKDSSSRWLTYQLSITPPAKFVRYLYIKV